MFIFLSILIVIYSVFLLMFQFSTGNPIYETYYKQVCFYKKSKNKVHFLLPQDFLLFLFPIAVLKLCEFWVVMQFV